MPEKKKHSKLALGLGLLFTIGIAPIKAGALPWVSLAWVSLCCISLSALLALKPSFNCKRTKAENERSRPFLFAYLFIAFQCWALAQSLFISPDSPASLNQSIIGLGMICLLSIWFFAVRNPKALHTLYTTLIVFSVVQAVYGLWVFLSGTDLLLWMPKLHYLDRPTGFFVNANHFAAYVVLGIILCLSRIMSNRPENTSRSFLVRSFDHLYSPNNALIFLLLVTLLATQSIGAIGSLSIVLLIMCLNSIWHSKQRKALVLSAAVVSALLVFFILSLDYASIEDQISGLSHTVSRRLALSDVALSMLKDNWFLGVGGGSFYSQFSPYRTLEIGNSYYNYAHNDLLQFWIEYGLIGVVILFLFITAVLRDNVRVLLEKKEGIQATFARASLYSTLAITIHSLVDFPLHIPGFSVCYIILISINSLNLVNRSITRDATSRV